MRAQSNSCRRGGGPACIITDNFISQPGLSVWVPAVQRTGDGADHLFRKARAPSLHRDRKLGSAGRRRWLGTPKLVRETSRRHWWQRGGPEKSVEDVKRDFSDIVLPPSLQARRPPAACIRPAAVQLTRAVHAPHTPGGVAQARRAYIDKYLARLNGWTLTLTEGVEACALRLCNVRGGRRPWRRRRAPAPRAQTHIRGLAAVTANTRAHGAPFRHMLFYGPPGAPPAPACGPPRAGSALCAYRASALCTQVSA